MWKTIVKVLEGCRGQKSDSGYFMESLEVRSSSRSMRKHDMAKVTGMFSNLVSRMLCG